MHKDNTPATRTNRPIPTEITIPTVITPPKTDMTLMTMDQLTATTRTSQKEENRAIPTEARNPLQREVPPTAANTTMMTTPPTPSTTPAVNTDLKIPTIPETSTVPLPLNHDLMMMTENLPDNTETATAIHTRMAKENPRTMTMEKVCVKATINH